jgi:hypothetical protein
MMAMAPWLGLTGLFAATYDDGRMTGPEPPTRASHAEPDDSGSRAVAVLLAVAALLAAVLATRAALLSDEASNAWQTSLRQELKRSVATLTDVRYVYGPEGDQAFMVATHEVMAEELRAAAAEASPEIAAVLDAEARVHDGVVEHTSPGMEFASERYRLEEGGFDLALRLSDIRGGSPDLAGIDPDAPLEEGDRTARHATLTLTAAVPVGAAFFVGALAMPFRRR